MRSSASGSSAPSAGVGGGAGAVAAATGLQGQSQAQTLGGTQKEEKAKSGAHMLGVQRPGLGGGGGGGGQGRAVLTMEDLGCAVGEYGVNVRRGEFYR
jgi:transcription initiation factor TFIID subunit 10